MTYIITIQGIEYEEEAETRYLATNRAAKRHRVETGAKYSIPVLMAVARTRSKENGKERYPVPKLEI